MGFGDFDWICKNAPIPLCAAVGHIGDVRLGVGIEPECYARNIELANTIIFQGATSFLHIVALIMTVIMLLHVRSKFTAVGTSFLDRTIFVLVPFEDQEPWFSLQRELVLTSF